MTDNTMKHAVGDVVDGDLIHGAEAISAFLGVSVRRAFYLLESSEVPGFKLGGRWALRKSAAIASFERREETAAPAPRIPA